MSDLLRAGVCCQGHAIYTSEDVDGLGRCTRCEREMADERTRIFGRPIARKAIPDSKLSNSMRPAGMTGGRQ